MNDIYSKEDLSNIEKEIDKITEQEKENIADQIIDYIPKGGITVKLYRDKNTAIPKVPIIPDLTNTEALLHEKLNEAGLGSLISKINILKETKIRLHPENVAKTLYKECSLDNYQIIRKYYAETNHSVNYCNINNIPPIDVLEEITFVNTLKIFDFIYISHNTSDSLMYGGFTKAGACVYLIARWGQNLLPLSQIKKIVNEKIALKNSSSINTWLGAYT